MYIIQFETLYYIKDFRHYKFDINKKTFIEIEKAEIRNTRYRETTEDLSEAFIYLEQALKDRIKWALDRNITFNGRIVDYSAIKAENELKELKYIKEKIPEYFI